MNYKKLLEDLLDELEDLPSLEVSYGNEGRVSFVEYDDIYTLITEYRDKVADDAYETHFDTGVEVKE